MIPYGPWEPDKSAVNVNVVQVAHNCLPAVNGHGPLSSLVAASTNALDGECLGAVAVYDDDGDVSMFAATATKLYSINAFGAWVDISRTAGGPYAAGGGERWSFANAGALVIGTNINDDAQKFLLGTSTNFQALGGTPPRARYIGVVRDFVVLGGLFGDERTIRWSGIANPEHWTVGVNSAGEQAFQAGGPVRGIIGGETGYIFQADRVQRMIFAPGSQEVFQFDEIEGGRGLAAPYSLVRNGREAFYLSFDGFYKFDTLSATSTPLGVGKWQRWFTKTIKPGTEQLVQGGLDPTGRYVIWAFSTVDNPNLGLNRCLIYDWTIDAATTAELNISAFAQFLTLGVNLDNMDGYGPLDDLPLSLDNPVWRGGAALLGIFGSDNKLSYLTGPSMQAELVTSDGEKELRAFIRGVRPQIDTKALSIALAMREAQGDPIVYANPERMEDTGVVPAHVSGNLVRAQVLVDAGATWTKSTGMTPEFGKIGKR